MKPGAYRGMTEARRGSGRRLRVERRTLLDEIKNQPCMDFDHRPGEIKEVAIARAFYRSEAQMLREIAKCDLVCANCHRIRTASRRQDSRKVA